MEFWREKEEGFSRLLLDLATKNVGRGKTLKGLLQLFLSWLLSIIGGVFSNILEKSEMASRPRPVVPQQIQPKGGGGGKQKNVPPTAAEGRNRRVLQDIGSIMKFPAVEGKLEICTKLLANLEAVPKKNKKPVKKIVNIPETKPVAVQKKVIVKPKPEAVTVINSEEEEGKKELIVNIDASDADNELAVVEYVDDIYKFYRLAEDENQVHGYMCLQTDIDEEGRYILMNWLVEIHNGLELIPEILYLTINIVDRYLSMKKVSRRDLQLVGITSMLIACKYEEIRTPDDFVYLSYYTCVREELLVMEKSILTNLGWVLTVPTPYVFLVRYSKASVQSENDKEMENMVLFLAELGLMRYAIAMIYRPSMIAASAVYAARCTLNRSPLWSETLKHHTGYSEDQLMECAKLLSSFHTAAAESAAAESELNGVYQKFSKPERSAVALVTPAKSIMMPKM